MTRNGVSGFTLIEMMIVTEIIAILVAVTYPSLMRQRIMTNEASAVQNLHQISGSQVTFNSANGRYGTFEELVADTGHQGTSFLSGTWAENIVKDGYTYTSDNIGDVTFKFIATPAVLGKSGVHSFTVDETGTISHTPDD